MRTLAYIDLPSGSAIFQILIAGLLGISVAFRSFWTRVWHFLTGRRRKEEPAKASRDGTVSTSREERPSTSEPPPPAGERSEDATAGRG